jgi:molybdate transport system substrate-binding protein
MNIKVIKRWIQAAIVAGLASATHGAAQDGARVAAASDLKFALDEIAAAYRQETGAPVTVVYGSSGNFTRQIQQGAPFELFLSADEGFVFQLADAGLTRDRGELYAEGRLVIFAPKESRLRADASLASLRASLASGHINRFAIANPEHAPYGRAAEQVLKGQGLWDAIQSRLVLGENVSQAAQFALSASAEGGIFAYSLALSPMVRDRGTYALLPGEWHAPLRQRMVLMKKASPRATHFYAFLRAPAARAVFRKYGFVLPGESS